MEYWCDECDYEVQSHFPIVCEKCDKYLCRKCSKKYDGEDYCIDCYEDLIKEQANDKDKKAIF